MAGGMPSLQKVFLHLVSNQERQMPSKSCVAFVDVSSVTLIFFNSGSSDESSSLTAFRATVSRSLSSVLVIFLKKDGSIYISTDHDGESAIGRTLSFPSIFNTISPSAFVHDVARGAFTIPWGTFEAFAILHKLALIVSMSCKPGPGVGC